MIVRSNFRPLLFSLSQPVLAAKTAAPITASALAFLSFLAISGVSQAQTPPIVVNIDGHTAVPDPPPLLQGGSVFVPLRGVLENLDAKVDYSPAERRIDILQNKKKYVLRPGVAGATVDAEVVPLAAPKIVGGRAFVPLRALAELFGYRVAWLPKVNTVAIYTKENGVVVSADHRTELNNAGAFGIEVDFSQATVADIPALLDAVKSTGAGLIKTRFDWATFQPQQSSEFDWTFYDAVVRESRLRGLRIVAILGDTAQWASVSTSTDRSEWSASPPKDSFLPDWSNYVKRVVGRYKNDVQAWQVWENPSAENFRSVPRTYRKLARAAIDAARLSDPKAIVHAAEPGGVELNFVNDLNKNGLTSSLDGIEIYPVSQWQPGVPNPADSFVLPYATLQDKLKVGDGKPRDYWLGGVSAPVVAPGTSTTLTDAQKALVTNYSPTEQADYLTRMFTLALATGAEKVFWNPLRDEPATDPTQTPGSGSGLQLADGTARPAQAAFQQVATNLSDKPYAGNLAFDQNAIALLFDNKKSGTLVAWSPSGAATLFLSSTGVDSHLPGAIFVATRPDSLVLDSTGTLVSLPDGPIKLTQRPLFITNVALGTATAAAARVAPGTLRLATVGTTYDKADEVKAAFDETSPEQGLFWRKFSGFGGSAIKFKEVEKRMSLMTEPQSNIFDLKSSRPFIYLDVADDFLYFGQGIPMTVTVEVHRPAPMASSIVNSTSGFRVEYDSPSGYKSTPYQVVEEGEGWATYSFPLPDANFANSEGYDLLINTNGSKRALNFGSISLHRGIDPTLQIAPQPLADPALAGANPAAPPIVAVPAP